VKCDSDSQEFVDLIDEKDYKVKANSEKVSYRRLPLGSEGKNPPHFNGEMNCPAYYIYVLKASLE